MSNKIRFTISEYNPNFQLFFKQEILTIITNPLKYKKLEVIISDDKRKQISLRNVIT